MPPDVHSPLHLMVFPRAHCPQMSLGEWIFNVNLPGFRITTYLLVCLKDLTKKGRSILPGGWHGWELTPNTKCRAPISLCFLTAGVKWPAAKWPCHCDLPAQRRHVTLAVSKPLLPLSWLLQAFAHSDEDGDVCNQCDFITKPEDRDWCFPPICTLSNAFTWSERSTVSLSMPPKTPQKTEGLSSTYFSKIRKLMEVWDRTQAGTACAWTSIMPC